ncbi:hypothetical protein JB92DRAFT_2835397 [Gautieria morchelliformis]|nr:hypothetical protein JB92DRAFT_2835397 [Gautieria morchelliformis]
MAESAADVECTGKPAVDVESTEKLAADTESTEKLETLEDNSTNSQMEEAWIAAAEEPSAATEHANAETREFTQAQVEQTATNQTPETGFGLPPDPGGRTVSSPVADPLPLIRIFKTAEGWKALAHQRPTEPVQQPTLTNGMGPTDLRGQKNSGSKRKRSPEAVAVLVPWAGHEA